MADDLPIGPHIHTHSIIGNRARPGPLAESSHLPQAESELVVPADHCACSSGSSKSADIEIFPRRQPKPFSDVGGAVSGDCAPAGFSVAVTSTFPWRNSSGSGRCRVPSASGSRIVVMVLTAGRLPCGAECVKPRGIVPTWSSHLPQAESEVVVPADHSVCREPAAVAEIKRILMVSEHRSR